MKTIACALVGGVGCDAKFTAETAEEMKSMFSEHAKVAHADMMAASTDESMAEWNTMFEKVWAETADDATSEAEVAPEVEATEAEAPAAE
ncbi:MAG: DUF1059 domain-containing protein [Patescibacteria group bacterium]